jgi:hypothetical protein
MVKIPNSKFETDNIKKRKAHETDWLRSINTTADKKLPAKVSRFCMAHYRQQNYQCEFKGKTDGCLNWMAKTGK